MSRHRLDSPDVEQIVPAPSVLEFAPATVIRGILYILAAVSTGVGLSYALGGPATTASLVAMAEIQPFPEVGGMRGWGVVLVIAGLALVLGRVVIGHGLAALVLLVWAGCSLATLINGTATGASGPPMLGGWAALHIWLLFARTGRSR